ncbi:uncharacterized protein TNCV_2556551 [Trichonephila clavipes]|nr:uncharacterized protein TNCV_2556551 [Trichonephila clavipes]
MTEKNILKQHVRLLGGAMRIEILLMDYNARSHRALILWPDLEGEKDLNDDHREENTDFSINPRFQECDEEDVETWMACDAEDCGFQMLNDDEIVTSLQEESDPVDDETGEDKDNNSNESSKGPSNAGTFSALETAME